MCTGLAEAHARASQCPEQFSFCHGGQEQVVVTLSGFQNPTLGELRDVAEALGAKCKLSFSGDVTHVCAAFENTPKTDAARASGRAWVVKAEWLRECQRARCRLPEAGFCLGASQAIGRPAMPGGVEVGVELYADEEFAAIDEAIESASQHIESASQHSCSNTACAQQGTGEQDWPHPGKRKRPAELPASQRPSQEFVYEFELGQHGPMGEGADAVDASVEPAVDAGEPDDLSDEVQCVGVQVQHVRRETAIWSGALRSSCMHACALHCRRHACALARSRLTAAMSVRAQREDEGLDGGRSGADEAGDVRGRDGGSRHHGEDARSGESGDDDVQIVSTKGQWAMIDFAHSRCPLPPQPPHRRPWLR